MRILSDPPLKVLSVEAASADTLTMLDPASTAPLLISGWRAATLSLANRRDAADPAAPVLIERSEWLDMEAARAIADPGQDGDRAPLGPLTPLEMDQAVDAETALKLARLAGLLPALWIIEGTGDEAAVSAELLIAAGTEVRLAARAKLPVDDLPDTQIAVFRASDGEEHVALIVGAFGGKPPLVRLHSECLTGDVFGSLKCDCGPQLKKALRLIAEAGGGVLLYLRQEGRGIGIANKIRAYALQDRGFDTVDANIRLGFGDDERDFTVAAHMLERLGQGEVRLLTNNPAKVAALVRHGIAVAERVPHRFPANNHNEPYLKAKARGLGHLF